MGVEEALSSLRSNVISEMLSKEKVRGRSLLITKSRKVKALSKVLLESSTAENSILSTVPGDKGEDICDEVFMQRGEFREIDVFPILHIFPEDGEEEQVTFSSLCEEIMRF